MPTGLAILAGLGQGLGKFPEGLLAGLKLDAEERRLQAEARQREAAERQAAETLGLRREGLGIQREQLAATGAHRQAQEERAERAFVEQSRATQAQEALARAGLDLRRRQAPVMVGEGVTDVYDPEAKTFTPVPRPPRPAFTPPETFKPSYTVGKRGDVTTTWKEPTPQQAPTLSERLAEAEARARTSPPGSQAQADFAKVQAAFGYEKKLAAARTEGRLGATPLPPDVQQALAVHNGILSTLAQLQQFNPEEVKSFSGLLNRPLSDIRFGLAGITGVGADARYAAFRTLMGRLQATAFGEGGKQLTPFEASVVFSYTPTGREIGGAAEIVAKIKYLEVFTRIARTVRLQLARTGRGDVDPDMFEQVLKQEMFKARLLIRVRNTKTGQTGTATLLPGDSLPPGVEEIR